MTDGGQKTQAVNFQLLANSGGMEKKTFSVLAQFKLPCKKRLTVSGESYRHKYKLLGV